MKPYSSPTPQRRKYAPRHAAMLIAMLFLLAACVAGGSSGAWNKRVLDRSQSGGDSGTSTPTAVVASAEGAASESSEAAVDEPHYYQAAKQASRPAGLKGSFNSFFEGLSGFFGDAAPAPEPQAAPVVPDGQTRIAVLLPLSGRHAALGKDLLNAATLATTELSDSAFALLPIDTQGTPEGARAAVKTAHDKGADLILGPLFSAEAKAISSTLETHGLNALSLTNDSTAADTRVYVMGFAPQPEIAQVVGYAKDQGITKFAGIFPRTDYGRVAQRFFESVLDYYDAELVAKASYDPSADVRPAVQELAQFDTRRAALVQERKRLQDAIVGAVSEEERTLLTKQLDDLKRRDTFGDPDYQAVMIVETGDVLRTLVPMLPYYDIDPRKIKFLGISRWEDIKPWQDTSFNGGWFATADAALRQSFSTRYADAFGKAPPRLASILYDGVALSVALHKEGGEAAFTDNNIARRNGFSGIDGIFRFDHDHVAERGLAVMEVTRSGLKTIEPAPKSFQD